MLNSLAVTLDSCSIRVFTHGGSAKNSKPRTGSVSTQAYTASGFCCLVPVSSAGLCNSVAQSVEFHW
eukprot:5133514-Amphidinium_carterae.1